jgi:hypothetical protein
MALSVKLYRVVGKGKDRRYIPIDLARRGRRSKEYVTGSVLPAVRVEIRIRGSGFQGSGRSHAEQAGYA